MKYKISNISKNNTSTNSSIKNYMHKVNYSFHKKKGKYEFSNLLLNKNKRKTKKNYNKSKIPKKIIKNKMILPMIQYNVKLLIIAILLITYRICIKLKIFYIKILKLI